MLNSEKIQESSHPNGRNNNTEQFFNIFCDRCMIALSSVAIAIADYLCHIKKKKKKNNNNNNKK